MIGKVDHYYIYFNNYDVFTFISMSIVPGICIFVMSHEPKNKYTVFYIIIKGIVNSHRTKIYGARPFSHALPTLWNRLFIYLHVVLLCRTIT